MTEQELLELYKEDKDFANFRVQKDVLNSLSLITKLFSGATKGEKGEDGYTPVKGKDYFTPDEIKELIKICTPKKGKDYFTEKELTNIVKICTPKKGVDYYEGYDGKDGEDGKDGVDGKTPVKGKDYFTKDEIDELTEKIAERVQKGIKVEKLPEFKNIAREVLKHIKIEDIAGYDRLVFNKKDQRWGGHGGKMLEVLATGTINGINTVFTIPREVGNAADVWVFRGGALQSSLAGDYTLSNNNTTITFAIAPVVGEVVLVKYKP